MILSVHAISGYTFEVENKTDDYIVNLHVIQVPYRPREIVDVMPGETDTYPGSGHLITEVYGEITGRVIDSDGDKVSVETPLVERVPASSFSSTGSQKFIAEIDDKGHFKLVNLEDK
jgi:hypothetical protein